VAIELNNGFGRHCLRAAREVLADVPGVKRGTQ